MSERPERPKRKLTVTSCVERATGEGKKGKWVLYTVAVTDEKGIPIDKEFRAWRMLEIGKLIEYEIERVDDEKFGTSFTLHPPRPQASLGARVEALEGLVADLQRRVSQLESGGGGAGGEAAGVW